MPRFERIVGRNLDMAADVMNLYHQELVERGVRIDFLFAYGERDENEQIKRHAIVKNGHRCFGVTKILSPKDRFKGMGDAEIQIDADWWEDDDRTDAERKALLDHELQHIAVMDGSDRVGRPKLKLRRHDVEFGWFKVVAERHGNYSIECQQARFLIDKYGQSFWPDIVDAIAAPLLTKSRMTALELAEVQKEAQHVSQTGSELTNG